VRRQVSTGGHKAACTRKKYMRPLCGLPSARKTAFAKSRSLLFLPRHYGHEERARGKFHATCSPVDEESTRAPHAFEIFFYFFLLLFFSNHKVGIRGEAQLSESVGSLSCLSCVRKKFHASTRTRVQRHRVWLTT
jgi:hypothetical protein